MEEGAGHWAMTGFGNRQAFFAMLLSDAMSQSGGSTMRAFSSTGTTKG
jgi:hypothetical protein